MSGFGGKWYLPPPYRSYGLEGNISIYSATYHIATVGFYNSIVIDSAKKKGPFENRANLLL